MKEKIHRVFVWLSIVAVSAGCGVYSFTGASIDPNVKTFTVHFISNQAPLVVPSLSQTLTDGLRNRFLTNTNLNQIDNGGDLEFSGSITNYAITPVAVQANETAALNRLTITLSMEFINHQNEKQNWTSTFSRYADYNSSSDITSIQDELIRLISEQLIEDVFNKAVVNW
jgi:hypothetical protein